MNPWARACILLGLGCTAVWVLDLSDALAWQLQGLLRHPWQAWTASLSHLSGAHFAGNLGALAVLTILGSFVEADRAAVRALLLSWPLATLSLLAWPEVQGYRGLSGLLCAMLGILWVHTTRATGMRTIAWLILLSMGAKLLSEHAWSQPIGYDPNWGFNVVYAAHLAGFAWGVLCGWCVPRLPSGPPKGANRLP